jgi:sulfatase maturation enzyme AslB (radical SAM superfamily)
LNRTVASVRDRLDLVGKLRQESVASRVVQLSQGTQRPSPVIVDLDPTSFCDLACPECISSDVLNHARFAGDRLVELCEELAAAGVRGVVFIGGGEPLLHRTTPAAMERLVENGVAVGLVTNGTHLPRLGPELVARLGWIRVSMDAGTQAVYDLFRPSRGRSKFQRVVANIRWATEQRAQTLGYSFVVMARPDGDGAPAHTNVADIPVAARLAHELGCDYLELKAQLRLDHTIDEAIVAQLDELREAVDAAQALASEHFELLLSSSMRALLAGDLTHQHKSYTWCPTAHLRTLVTPTGMYACAYHRGNEAFRMGDVIATPFAEAWSRAELERVDPSRDCRFHCARHAINLACNTPEDRARLGRDATPDTDIFF